MTGRDDHTRRFDVNGDQPLEMDLRSSSDQGMSRMGGVAGVNAGGSGITDHFLLFCLGWSWSRSKGAHG